MIPRIQSSSPAHASPAGHSTCTPADDQNASPPQEGGHLARLRQIEQLTEPSSPFSAPPAQSTAAQRPSTLESLPNELLLDLLDHLPVSDRENLADLNSRFKELDAKGTAPWVDRLVRQFEKSEDWFELATFARQIGSTVPRYRADATRRIVERLETYYAQLPEGSEAQSDFGSLGASVGPLIFAVACNQAKLAQDGGDMMARAIIMTDLGSLHLLGEGLSLSRLENMLSERSKLADLGFDMDAPTWDVLRDELRNRTSGRSDLPRAVKAFVSGIE